MLLSCYRFAKCYFVVYGKLPIDEFFLLNIGEISEQDEFAIQPGNAISVLGTLPSASDLDELTYL